MKRLPIEPREDWNTSTLNEGLMWAVTEQGPYWSEAMEQPVYYRLTNIEQKLLEQAGIEIQQMCFETLEWLINNEDDAHFQNYWLEQLGITDMTQRNLIYDSWNNDEWAMYGRFDFLMENGIPKLLEYNADTPATLLETAMVQWNWFIDNKDKLPGTNQFNDLHDSLVRHWADMASNGLDGKIHFTGCSDVEDMAIVSYLAETAREAGYPVQVLPIEHIGFDGTTFVDIDDMPINNIFKFYPWEWLLEDEFGKYVPTAKTRWIEPAWKTILNNKAFLALLWKRYPDCQFLVPAYTSATDLSYKHGDTWVTKPIRSRCGANVCIWNMDTHNVVEHNDGIYGDNPKMFQKFIEGKKFDGVLPMLSVWMVGEDAVALSIRECDSLITTNNSRFIPHVFEE